MTHATRSGFLFSLALLLLIPGTARASDAAAPASPEKKQVQKIGIDEFDKKRQDKDTVVLDVRTPDEFKKGHVPGAVNIDVQNPDFREKVAKLDKSRTYLVHCARGMRSARAAKMLSAMGFSHLFDFSGGFDQWKKAGKPVAKD